MNRAKGGSGLSSQLGSEEKHNHEFAGCIMHSSRGGGEANNQNNESPVGKGEDDSTVNDSAAAKRSQYGR